MTLALPAISLRDSLGRSFAEVMLVNGPEQIGATGGNTYLELYGRPYALVLEHAPRVLRLYRGAIGGGGYEEVLEGLPEALFGPELPEDARRFSAAFDQSARIIVAYEAPSSEGPLVRVTRWEGSAYVQNVTFDAVDPALIIDATLADPRGYPRAADGWSVYEAHLAGIPVLFEWLAGDPVVWLENAIPDSDVLLFYLTPDRTQVQARVQRQLYATVHAVHTFDAPVILDRVVALPGRYQLLVSDTDGEPLAEMLISDPYLGDFIINPCRADEIDATATPEAWRLEADTYPTEATDAFDGTISPETLVSVGDTAFVSGGPEEVDGEVQPETMVSISTMLAYLDDTALDGGVADEGVAEHRTTHVFASDQEDLDATAAPETIRVQAV